MMKATISKQRGKSTVCPRKAENGFNAEFEFRGLNRDAHIIPDAVPRTVSVLLVCVPRDSPESNSKYDRTPSIYVTF
jgi:hypothetical protein